ncbi:MAG: MobA/MobL family protein, partial [Clostridia bacterium]|nr:MobA/MobL family protein [Clostridia bacterium]
MSAAAYQSGDKLYSEYEHEWKSGDHLERIVHKEILLPTNAPEKYRDRATLWNAVDASETKSTAQTARRIILALPKELTREQNIELIRNYCQTSFVDRGMIADFAVHDDEEGNPHAHVLLTMRSLNAHGEWNPKTRTEFVLDENGERIQTANGKYKRRCVSWDGWNDRGNCEIWRHEWEVMQNAALEKAGRTERVDMQSFERQGIELAPTVHLGPAAFALEKKGIHTELGDHNRAVKLINALFTAIKNKLKALRNWLTELSEIISDQEKLENPGDYPLLSVLMAYYDLREKERWDWNYGARNKGGINDLKEKASVFTFLRENDIYSLNDFGRLLNSTSSKIREMESAKK